MNIELGIRLTDSNYEYDNSVKNENTSKSYELHTQPQLIKISPIKIF